MLIAVIAHGAQIVVAALGTLPAYAEYRLLTTCIAHRSLVPDAGRCTVEHAEVVGAGASVVGGSAVVPDDDHLFARLEGAYGSYMTFSAILQINTARIYYVRIMFIGFKKFYIL